MYDQAKRPQSIRSPTAQRRPFQVDSRQSPREREASNFNGQLGAFNSTARVSAQTFEAGADGGGTLDPANSTLLESSLAGASAPLRPDAWANGSGIPHANSAVLHRGFASDRLASHLATDAFTVGHHVFMSSSASAASRRQQLLQHELVHVGQNRGKQDGARVINRAPLHEFSGGLDYAATEEVQKYVLDASTPYEAAKFARDLDRFATEPENMAYLERMLWVLNGARKLSEDEALRARYFLQAVRRRSAPQSEAIAPEQSSPGTGKGNKKEDKSSGVIRQARLTAEERAYAEADGFFSVTGLSRRDMTKELEGLKSAQDKKFSAPKGATRDEKKELGKKRKAGEITLIKAAMEAELAMVMPGASDPVGAWFGDHQTNVSFLGRKIDSSTNSQFAGVHKSFAERLASAESEIVSTMGLGSAKVCGEALGVEKIGGLRGPKSATGGTLPSLHVYGLAIDINDADNPMLRDSKKPKGFDKDLIFTNEVITQENASELINGKRISINVVDRSKMPAGDVIKLISSYSDLLEIYFSLRGDREAVQKYLEMHSLAEDQKREGRSADEWLDIIENDYQVAVGNDLLDVAKPKDGETASAPKVAPLITLGEEMIVAMENHGIEWAGRHHTPDIMHFDLRSEHFKSRRPKG